MKTILIVGATAIYLGGTGTMVSGTFKQHKYDKVSQVIKSNQDLNSVAYYEYFMPTLYEDIKNTARPIYIEGFSDLNSNDRFDYLPP
jgi:hypothetical protein